MSFTGTGTHAVVVAVLADLSLASRSGDTGGFTADEVKATMDALTIVASGICRMQCTKRHAYSWAGFSSSLRCGTRKS